MVGFKITIFLNLQEEATGKQAASKHKSVVLNVPKLCQLYKTRTDSSAYKKLLAVRKQLPVYQHKGAVLEQVNRHNVVVVAGKTGSGKSTQIPQFLLDVSCPDKYSEPRFIRPQHMRKILAQLSREPIKGTI